MSGDLLVTGIGRLVTNDPARPGPLGEIDDAAVTIRDGAVVWAGPESEVPSDQRESPTIRVDGRCVLPGFVDAHTHLVFAGDRSEEFARRLAGDRYEEILAAGGGIQSTVAATRATNRETLVAGAAGRLRRMLAMGTTTAEVKSGYGLDVATEVRMLEAAVAAGAESGARVVPTLLGAHVVPLDHRDRRADYVRLVIDEMLPAAGGIARFCDVFSDAGAFTVDEARAILEAAAGHGLRAKLHAEQLGPTGAARLAADLGAVSADHLDHVTRDDAAALAAAGTVGVLLPGVTLSMRLEPPPWRTLVDAGVPVALATDCNPGTSHVESLPLMAALAALDWGMPWQQAVWGITRGGALAVDRPDLGSVTAGAAGDLVVLDAGHPIEVIERLGIVPIHTVIVGGRIAV